MQKWCRSDTWRKHARIGRITGVYSRGNVDLQIACKSCFAIAFDFASVPTIGLDEVDREEADSIQ